MHETNVVAGSCYKAIDSTSLYCMPLMQLFSQNYMPSTTTCAMPAIHQNKQVIYCLLFMVEFFWHRILSHTVEPLLIRTIQYYSGWFGMVHVMAEGGWHWAILPVMIGKWKGVLLWLSSWLHKHWSAQLWASNVYTQAHPYNSEIFTTILLYQLTMPLLPLTCC